MWSPRVQAQAQQDGLSVNEETPAGQTEQQQDDDVLLKDHPHPLQVLTTKCLHDINILERKAVINSKS